MRDALGLKPGEKLTLERVGRRLILEAAAEPFERISYEEFRRRVPKYNGPPATIEDMNLAVDRMFEERRKP